MNFKDYQRDAWCFRGKESLDHWAIGLAGEVGEVLEPIKKHVYRGAPLDVDALKLELGDVLWYVSALCSQLGLTLEDVARANVAKLSARHPERVAIERTFGEGATYDRDLAERVGDVWK